MSLKQIIGNGVTALRKAFKESEQYHYVQISHDELYKTLAKCSSPAEAETVLSQYASVVKVFSEMERFPADYHTPVTPDDLHNRPWEDVQKEFKKIRRANTIRSTFFDPMGHLR